jgi:hypothetical protein
MIHPLFTQYNGDLGNRLNAGCPGDDYATHGETVIKAIAGVVAAYATAEDPRAYGKAVAHRVCPNILPFKVGTPAVFGFGDGTVARLQTTRPMLCSPWQRTLLLVSESARIQPPRNRRRHFHTCLLQLRVVQPRRELGFHYLKPPLSEK